MLQKSMDIGKLLLPLSKLKNLQYLCLFGNPLTLKSSRPKQLTIKTLSRLQYYDYELITSEVCRHRALVAEGRVLTIRLTDEIARKGRWQ